MSRFRALYGAGPLHLVAVLACFAFVLLLLPRIAAPDVTVPMAVWFVGALLLHDLVLYPAYATVDRAAVLGSRAARARVPWLNHVRVPALLSGLLLLLWFPLVLAPGAATYESALGLPLEGYGLRWLAVTAVLFLGSALVYGLRWRRAPARRPAPPADAARAAGDAS